MRLFIILFFLGFELLFSRNTFFRYDNSIKVGAGINELNSVPGISYQMEYTRHVANILFTSLRISYANASDDAPGARYASQEMTSASFNVKINPLVIDRHIISISAGIVQSYYSCSGNYGNRAPADAAVSTSYSKKTNGTGYRFGTNYDYLFSRNYFISLSSSVIKYDVTVYTLLVSIGIIF